VKAIIMPRLVVRVSRVLLIAALLAAPALPSQPQPTSTGETPTAGMYPEVRLRKLHLVRPDLIPYPIASEVVC
jgi:hypothetical protein